MKNVLKADFVRAFKGWRFWSAGALMFLMWELNSRRFQWKDDVLYLFVHVWGRSITSLMAMVISAMVFSFSYCEDGEMNFRRYCLLRTEAGKYTKSKICACFCGSFAVTVLGTAAFLWRQSFVLPLIADNSYTIENFRNLSCFGRLLSDHPVCFILLQMAMHGMFCGGMSVLTLAFSTFVQSAYGVFIIPFLLHYCFYYMLAKPFPSFHIFNMWDVFFCLTTYTDSPAVFLRNVFLVTAVFVLAGYGIMLWRVRREYR